LITVQDRDLANLPEQARRKVRALQRAYLEIWVDTLRRLIPGLPADAARVAVHGAFGLLNSTPHSATAADQPRVAALLRRMALAALTTSLLATCPPAASPLATHPVTTSAGSPPAGSD
ncbi:MAG TPA: hypothetical protein VHH34_14025, partial [Pseudonocardiaceae bacterium]|nr:hypothetical protein [Pseudonocardiaceae bacterium]